ncbi:MAG: TPM domain-containing protein [Desulforhopalus sp.]
MQNPAEHFLTAEEQKHVTEAVRKAELKTSGEIVPMIVSRSHNYPTAAATCAVSFGLPLALATTTVLGEMLWIGPQNMWLMLGVFGLLYIIFYPLVMKREWLKKYFLKESQVTQEVSEGALAAFYSEQLYKTENENGILLYISVLEQKVWILADRGINEKIDQQEWDSVVTDLTAGIKAGNRCESMCNAVERIGHILQKHFPYQKDDQDELHNLIIR